MPGWVEALILPPNIFFMIGPVGVLLLAVSRTLGVGVLCVSVVGGYFFSTFFAAHLTGFVLQRYPAFDPQQPVRADAVVVLAGGLTYSPVYGGADVSGSTLRRLRYGVYLAKTLQKPLVVSGGHQILIFPETEAELMARIAQEEWMYPVTFADTTSANTWENAVEVARWLEIQDWRRVLLVTDGYHMLRAVAAFRHHRVQVVPAPVSLYRDTPKVWSIGAWVPLSRAGDLVYRNWRELFALLGYHWRYGLSWWAPEAEDASSFTD